MKYQCTSFNNSSLCARISKFYSNILIFAFLTFSTFTYAQQTDAICEQAITMFGTTLGNSFYGDVINIYYNTSSPATVSSFSGGNALSNPVSVWRIFTIPANQTAVIDVQHFSNELSVEVLEGSCSSNILLGISSGTNSFQNVQISNNTAAPKQYFLRISKNATPPQIVTQPQSQTICGGSLATLSVSATGTSLSYIWNTGATTTSINTSISGFYDVTVLGIAGFEVSNTVSITANSTTGCTLQAHYPFDGNTLDASGNNRHGTQFGGVNYAINRFHNIQSSLLLDGINDVVTIPNVAQSDFTISVWINTTMVGSTHANNQWYNGSGIIDGSMVNCVNDFGISLYGDGLISAGGGNPLPSGCDKSMFTPANPKYNDGKWHHLVLTRNKATSVMTIIIDNVTISSNTFNTSDLNATNYLTIGNDNYDYQTSPGVTQFYFKGNIDDIRVYSKVLNNVEINNLYTEYCATYFAQAPTVTFDGVNLGVAGTYLGANFAWSYNGSISGGNLNIYSSALRTGIYNVTVTNAACKAIGNYNLTSLTSNINAGLVAYYPFLANVEDASGNNNNGTLPGTGITITNNRFGIPSSAIDFILPNTNPGIIFNTNYTASNILAISMWFNASSLNANSYASLFMYDNSTILKTTDISTGLYYSNLINGGANYSIFARTGVVGNDFNIGGVQKDKWNHYYVSYNKATNKLISYLNNIKIAEVNATPITLGNFLRLGRSTRFSSDSEKYMGQMDEIRIYNRELNVSEISDLYHEYCSTYFAQAPTVTFDGVNLGVAGTYLGANFAWSYNGTSISGYNTHLYDGTLNAGLYAVTVTNAACKASSSFNVLTTQVNLNKGIVVHYKLDGNTVEDQSRWSVGTIIGAASYTENRFFTSAKTISIAGTNYVTFGSVPGSVLGNKQKFASMWVMPSSLQTGLLTLGNSGATGSDFRITTNGTLNLGIDVVNGLTYSTGIQLTQNVWNFIFAYWDGSRYYVGKVNQSGVFTEALPVIMPSNNLLQGVFILGREFFNGISSNARIDEFRMYNRVLNMTEINNLYAEGCPGFMATFSYGTGNYCQTGTATPTGTFTGGYFKTISGLSINSTTGIVNLAASTAGIYNVEYHVPAQYGCTSMSGYAMLTITSAPNSTPNTPLCADAISVKTLLGAATASWMVMPAGIGNITGNIFTVSTLSGVATVTNINMGCVSPAVIFSINASPVNNTSLTDMQAGTSRTLSGMGGTNYTLVSGAGYIIGNILYAGSLSGINVISYTNSSTGCNTQFSISVYSNVYYLGSVSTNNPTLPILIPVGVTTPISSGIIGLDITLPFNASVLVPTGNAYWGSVSTVSGNQEMDVTVLGNNIEAGLSFNGSGEFQGQGDIIYFEFNLANNLTPGIYTLPGASIIESTAIGNRNTSTQMANLTVNVYFPTFTGKVIYWDNIAKPVGNNGNAASGATQILSRVNCASIVSATGTDFDGNFSVNMSLSGYSYTINRDVPNSTSVMPVINSVDARMVTSIRQNTLIPTLYQLIAADVNNDGRVTSGDRTLIRRRIVSLDPQFANVPDWKFLSLPATFTGFNKDNVPALATCLGVSSSLQGGYTVLGSQTIAGILMGDVNGSWVFTPAGANLREQSADEVVYKLGDATQNSDGTWTIPVEIHATEAVDGVDIDLTFVDNTLAIQKVVGTNSDSDFVYNSAIPQAFLATGEVVTHTIPNAVPSFNLIATGSKEDIKASKFASATSYVNGNKATSVLQDVTKLKGNKGNKLSAYPNPSEGGIFSINLNGYEGIYSLSVANIIGVNVHKQTGTGIIENVELNLSALPKGIYYLQLQTETGSFGKKLIIK